MMRFDAFKFQSYHVRIEINATKKILTSHICSTDESELKEFPVSENLSQSCSMYKEESKVIIVDKFSTENDKYESKGIIVNKFSTDEGESECVINKQKDANYETEYEEYPVTYDVKIFFNVFKCGRKILNILNNRAWLPQDMNTIQRCWKL